jgi:hypothetical protein
MQHTEERETRCTFWKKHTEKTAPGTMSSYVAIPIVSGWNQLPLVRLGFSYVNACMHPFKYWGFHRLTCVPQITVYQFWGPMQLAWDCGAKPRWRRESPGCWGLVMIFFELAVYGSREGEYHYNYILRKFVKLKLKVTWNAFKSRNFWHILSLSVINIELTMFVLVSLKK